MALSQPASVTQTTTFSWADIAKRPAVKASTKAPASKAVMPVAPKTMHEEHLFGHATKQAGLDNAASVAVKEGADQCPHSSSNSTVDENEAMSSALSETDLISSSNSTVDESERESSSSPCDTDSGTESDTPVLSRHSELAGTQLSASLRREAPSFVPEASFGWDDAAIGVGMEMWHCMQAQGHFIPEPGGNQRRGKKQRQRLQEQWNAAALYQYQCHWAAAMSAYQWAAAAGEWAAQAETPGEPATIAESEDVATASATETAAEEEKEDSPAPHLVAPVTGLTALQASLFAVVGPPPGLEICHDLKSITSVPDYWSDEPLEIKSEMAEIEPTCSDSEPAGDACPSI